MSANKGEIDVRVLADGTLRIESADMSGVAHKAADEFFKEVTRLLGGDFSDTKLRPHSHHHDEHEHDHVHQ